MARPPVRRIELGFDPECSFCWTWVRRFQEGLLRDWETNLVPLTHEQIDEADTWRVWLHYDGQQIEEVHAGQAMLSLLELRYPRWARLWDNTLADRVADAAYRVVSDHRGQLCRLMSCEQPPYIVSEPGGATA